MHPDDDRDKWHDGRSFNLADGHFPVCILIAPPASLREALRAWPKGEQRIAQAAFGALFPKGNLRQKRLDGISETTNLFWYKDLRAQFGATLERDQSTILTGYCLASAWRKIE
jgi:hypothetical protein